MVVVDGTITSSVMASGFIVVVAVLVDVVVVVALSVASTGVALSIAFTIVVLSVVLMNGDVVGNVVALLSAVLLVLAVVAAISTDIPVASGTSVCSRSKNSPTCSATMFFNICHSTHLNMSLMCAQDLIPMQSRNLHTSDATSYS